jgi:drug/metabolite transporter (DMT)-like permease
VTCALLGIITMAIGAVILKRGTAGVGAIEGTFIRLLAASAFGALISGILGQFGEITVLLKNRTGTFYLCSATLLGTVIGVYLMLLAYKYCPTGIAATLTSTTPLFVIPVAYYAYKQSITKLAIAGACIAFGGVCGLLAGG